MSQYHKKRGDSEEGRKRETSLPQSEKRRRLREQENLTGKKTYRDGHFEGVIERFGKQVILSGRGKGRSGGGGGVGGGGGGGGGAIGGERSRKPIK